MHNIDLLQHLEDVLLEAENTITSLNKATFTEHHAQQLLVLRQFMYGLVWECSCVIRSNSKTYY